MEGSELDQDTSLAFMQHLLWNPSAIGQTASFLEQQSLQRSIFPSGLVLDKTGVGTPVTHSIYTLLADDSADEVLYWLPPRDSQVIESNNDMGICPISTHRKLHRKKYISHPDSNCTSRIWGLSYREKIGAKNWCSSSTISERLAGTSVSLDRFTNALHCICLAVMQSNAIIGSELLYPVPALRGRKS